VALLELRNLVVRPAMMAVGPGADSFHLTGWVVGAKADVDGVLHHDSKCHPKRVGSSGMLGARRHQSYNVLTPQVCRTFVAMLRA
jgi:hypothetical protein